MLRLRLVQRACRAATGGAVVARRALAAFAATRPAAARAAAKPAVEDIYRKQDPVAHVLLRPGMYVGATTPTPCPRWLWAGGDRFSATFDPKKGLPSHVPALVKIFDEVLVNALDNKARDPGGMRRLDVTITAGHLGTPDRITVRNDGHGIPVEVHKKEGCYVPELVFGHLLTGSNFDGDGSGGGVGAAAFTGGRHGYGAKLANIFSTEFTVETYDSSRGLKYKQTWRDNMGVREAPVVTRVPRDSADAAGGDYTLVSFVPDLKRFGVTRSIDVTTVNLMQRRVVDAAGTMMTTTAAADGTPKPIGRGVAPVTVTLNGVPVPGSVSTFLGYCKMFTPPASSHDRHQAAADLLSPLAYAQVADGWECVVGAANVGNIVPAEYIPYNQPGAVESFVNGINTPRGGTHVQAVQDALVKRLQEAIQKTVPKDSPVTVTPASVRNHMRFWVNCRAADPSFDSQSKEALTSPVNPRLAFPDAFVRKIVDDLGVGKLVVDSLEEKARVDDVRSLWKATKTAQSRVKSIPKLEDANLAGTRHGHECTLILTEGDSAKALAVAGLAVVGRDRYGVFPLRGKLLNVRDLKPKEALENAEVAAIVAILGLDFTQTYAGLAPDQRGLRYGRVMIMADQDHDGSHIKGLLINLFHTYWPELVVTAGAPASAAALPAAAGAASVVAAPPSSSHFLEQFVTPIIKARRGAAVKEFFSLRDYEAWRAATLAATGSSSGTGGWSIKYYKGLGTSTSVEARAYFGDLGKHVKPFVPGADAAVDSSKIVMAFAKDKSDERKAWLLERAKDAAATTAAAAQASAAAATPIVPVVSATSAPVAADIGAPAATAVATKKRSKPKAGDAQPAVAPFVVSADTSVSFTDFIDSDLREFSSADLVRSVPSVIDGLKPSQRKVLFACFMREGGRASGSRPWEEALAAVDASGVEEVGNGSSAMTASSTTPAPVASAPAKGGKAAAPAAAPASVPQPPPFTPGPEIKVAQLAGYVAEHTAYHHGEVSLASTIIGMAQDFVGSNNVNLLEPVGQFGTRLMGGKDAASARYIFTRLSRFARLLFPAADDPLLKRRDDDGTLVEPAAYAPVVPLVLLNGASGIGTGWSTVVPPHHPLRVIDAVKSVLQNDSSAGGAGSPSALPALAPWWRNFGGSVEFSAKTGTCTTRGAVEWMTPAAVALLDASAGQLGAKKKRGASASTAASSAADLSASLDSTGPSGSDYVRITELPVGVWTDSYKAWLQAQQGKGLVAGIREYHSEARVSFVVQLTPDGVTQATAAGADTFFKLSSTLSTRNMHLFSPSGCIKKYDTAGDILADFMPVRRALYHARKAHLQRKAATAAVVASSKARFLQEVIDGRVKLMDRKRGDLVQQLWRDGFPAVGEQAVAAAGGAPLQLASGGGVDAAAFAGISHVIDAGALATATGVVHARHFASDPAFGVVLQASHADAPPSSGGHGSGAGGGGSGRGFDYLLNTPLVQLTAENLASTHATAAAARAAYDRLLRVTPEQMWAAELDALAAAVQHHA